MTAPADELISLYPTAVALRYGQSPPDANGRIIEMFRVELDTDRGPFALELTPAGAMELASHLIKALQALPAERARWAAK